MAQAGADERLYFAYGANLDREHMRRRCPAARSGGAAELPGYRFVVNQCGWATVVADPCSTVHGVLWWLSPECEATLDEQEGVAAFLYGKQMLTLIDDTGHPVEALVYVASETRPGRPNPGYLERILRWAADWQLPDAYRTKLAACLGPDGE